MVKSVDRRQAVIDNLDFKVKLELFSQNTESLPKLKVGMLLPELVVTLNEGLYGSILKIGECFEVDQRRGERVSRRIVEKTEIKEKASKIGMVFIRDSMTQVWKKYVAIMSENYIYLYIGTKDEDYYAYYYIKNAELETTHDSTDKVKPYHFRIRNSLNEVTLGFDKPDSIQDWVNKIKKLSKKDEDPNTATLVLAEENPEKGGKKNHNLLNVMV